MHGSHGWSLKASLLVPVMIVLALAGCTVTPTPYQPSSDGYGYFEQRIEANRYRVGFVGNSATSREQVANYALFRAAEVTVKAGGDYFKIVKEDSETQPQSFGGGPSVGFGLGTGGSNVGVGVSTILGGGRGSYNYARYLDIVTYKGDKPADDPNAYSAWEVIDRLKPAVTAPPPA